MTRAAWCRLAKNAPKCRGDGAAFLASVVEHRRVDSNRDRLEARPTRTRRARRSTPTEPNPSLRSRLFVAFDRSIWRRSRLRFANSWARWRVARRRRRAPDGRRARLAHLRGRARRRVRTVRRSTPSHRALRSPHRRRAGAPRGVHFGARIERPPIGDARRPPRFECAASSSRTPSAAPGADVISPPANAPRACPARVGTWRPRGSRTAKRPAAFAALVDAPDVFDGELFGVSPAEAAACDPQQRLLLDAVVALAFSRASRGVR